DVHRVGDVDPRAYDVLQRRPQRAQGARDLVYDEVRLGGGVVAADQPVAVQRRRARDEHAPALPHRAGVAGEVLPHRARADPAAAAVVPGDGVGPRHLAQVVAEVARRREVRRPAVLVAAVAGYGAEPLGRGRELGDVVVAEAQLEQAQRVVDVLALAQAGADDDAADAGGVEDRARRDVRHRDAVAPGHV